MPTFFHFLFAGQKQLALDLVQKHPEFSELLGEPVKTGWFLGGRVHSDTDDSCAFVSVPVSGSKASGRLEMASLGKGDAWDVIYAKLEIENGKWVELADPDLETKSSRLKPCIR